MPVFQFTARDMSGQSQSGELAADTASALAAQLRGRGWIILDVQPAREGGARFSFEKLNPFYWMPPGKLDVEIAFQQIASMLRSGLTLLSAIKTAGEQSSRPSMARIWKRIYERIEEGSSFAKALSEHTCFPNFVVQLVNVGEQSGTLDVVLTRGVEHLERTRNLRMTLLNALMYPVIVLLMAVSVAGFMVLSVIPKLQKFLSGRNRKLPAMTQMLLDISTFAQNYLPHMLIGFVVGSIVLLLIYRLPAGRQKIDAFVLRVPLLGGLLRTSATAIFSRSLGLLLQSGITLLEALGTVEKLIANRALSIHIGQVRDHVIQGGTLAEPLTRERIFMPMLGRMVAVGEMTGTLDPVLNEVADFHEKDLAASVRRYSVLVEPAVIIVVGGIVGFVYIAFFVALFSLAG